MRWEDFIVGAALVPWLATTIDDEQTYLRRIPLPQSSRYP
jgi:hypothetical protein